MIKQIIKELNDNFRKSFLGGHVIISQKVQMLPAKSRKNYLNILNNLITLLKKMTLTVSMILEVLNFKITFIFGK